MDRGKKESKEGEEIEGGKGEGDLRSDRIDKVVPIKRQ